MVAGTTLARRLERVASDRRPPIGSSGRHLTIFVRRADARQFGQPGTVSPGGAWWNGARAFRRWPGSCLDSYETITVVTGLSWLEFRLLSG
jgi:hypothetical protein